jgi:preprotein translocase subunit SecD
MNSMMILFVSVALLLTTCTGNSTTKSKTKTDDTLREVPEHHVKDNQEISNHDSTILHTGWYYVIDTANGVERRLDKSSQTFFLDPLPIVTAKNFTSFEIYESNADGHKYLGLTLRLDKEGTENWSSATANSIGKQLAFVLDNRLLQVARVNSQITAGVTALNRGDYTREELENFKTIIKNEK